MWHKHHNTFMWHKHFNTFMIWWFFFNIWLWKCLYLITFSLKGTTLSAITNATHNFYMFYWIKLVAAFPNLAGVRTNDLVWHLPNFKKISRKNSYHNRNSIGFELNAILVSSVGSMVSPLTPWYRVRIPVGLALHFHIPSSSCV